ncbi:hypothetical protein HPB52_006382 [Rhipicephalus sanguineus]|uniref:Uncharacterized protein n=1 Tax=Rhipicephalus sanguineus TaxID=34632 RepID=A0A9D4T1A5_RHISA|nr:hypothetical protein HPB52_006382 [Rhipicephalus sanguineus]
MNLKGLKKPQLLELVRELGLQITATRRKPETSEEIEGLGANDEELEEAAELAEEHVTRHAVEGKEAPRKEIGKYRPDKPPRWAKSSQYRPKERSNTAESSEENEPYIRDLVVNCKPCRVLRDSAATMDVVHPSYVEESPWAVKCWFSEADDHLTGYGLRRNDVVIGSLVFRPGVVDAELRYRSLCTVPAGHYVQVCVTSSEPSISPSRTVEAGSLILSILAAAATVSTTDFASFVVARMLLTGSLGAVALAMGVAMFEASYSQRQRQLSVCFGHLVVSLVALLPRLLSSLMVLDRRAVCLAILLCAFAMFVMVLGGIEESPRWLRALFEAATSGDSKAQTVSSILVRKYSKVMGKVRGRKQPTVSSVGLLFDQALRTRTLVLAFTLFALLNSLPALADEDVLSMERLNDVTRPMLRVCSIVAADQLLRECTRREALLLALPCVCVLVCAEAVAEATAAQSTLPLIRELLVNSILANLTMVCVYCLELYPTSARATGLGSVYFAGGVCATASPLLLTLRLERRLLQISTVPLTVAAMFVVTLLPETKDTPLPETLCDLEGTSRRLGSAEADDLLPEADTTTELPCRNRQPQPGQAPNVPHYSSISGARAFFD